MENLPEIEHETASPAFLSVAAWTGVSLIGGPHPIASWAQAAKLVTELNDGVSEPDDAMAAKARALIAGASNELEKIRAIGAFAQQVNYVSIQLNVSKGGGYRPHGAAQVFQKRYGDCKDKANLMRAMLKAVGITAYPVAIYSGDRTHVSQEWPSLGAFNHAISAIRVSPSTTAPAVLDHPRLGRLLFFDPTDPHVPAGYLPEHEQASLALVGAAEGGDLVRVPAAPSIAAARERTVDAVLTADGALTGSFVEKRYGQRTPVGPLGIPAQLEAGLFAHHRTLDCAGNPRRYQQRDRGGGWRRRFVLKGQFASARYAQVPQARMLIFRAAPLRHGDTMRLTEKTRKYPVVMDGDALDETVRIEMPAAFRVDELPEPIHVESKYGKYDATWTAHDGKLVFHRMVETQAQTVPAAQYGELKKFLDLVYGSAEAQVVLLR